MRAASSSNAIRSSLVGGSAMIRTRLGLIRPPRRECSPTTIAGPHEQTVTKVLSSPLWQPTGEIPFLVPSVIPPMIGGSRNFRTHSSSSVKRLDDLPGRDAPQKPSTSGYHGLPDIQCISPLLGVRSPPVILGSFSSLASPRNGFQSSHATPERPCFIQPRLFVAGIPSRLPRSVAGPTHCWRGKARGG